MRKIKTSFMFLCLAALSLLLTFQNCGSSSPTGSLYGGSSYDSYGDDDSEPKVTIIDKPSDFSKLTTTMFQVTVQVSSLGLDYQEYSLDNLEWTRAGNVINLTGLSAGPHQILFRAKDRNGKMSEEVKYSWIVDTRSPMVSFGADDGIFVLNAKGEVDVSIPVILTDDLTQPTMQECKVLGVTDASFAPIDCKSSDEFSAKFKKAGSYRLFVQAKDDANNTVQKNFLFSVTADSSALPAPYLSKKPRPSTNTQDVILQVDAVYVVGATLSCILTDLNGVDKSIPCQSGVALRFDDLPVSTYDTAAQVFRNYKFKSRLSKSGVYSAWASTSWTIDIAKPTIEFSSPTDGAVLLTNSLNVIFSAKDNSHGELSMECVLDGVVSTCLSGTPLFLENLAGGSHQFSVTVTDLAGNATNQMISWSNKSCNPSELNFQWPLSGQEGADWALLSYMDLNSTESNIRDWSGMTNDRAKAYDKSIGIQLTTGNYSTIVSTNDFARVFAAESGVVTEVVNNQPDRIFTGAALQSCRDDDTRNKFNYIKIRHSNGMYTRYDYLQTNSIPFAVDSTVSKGAVIGRLGASGCHDFPRLRFVTKHCDDKTIVDPIYLGRLSKTYNVPVKMVNTTFYPYSSDNFASTWAAMIKTPPVNPIITKTKGISIVGFLTGAISGDQMQYELAFASKCTVGRDDKSLIKLRDATRTVSVGGIVTNVGIASIPCSGQWKFRAFVTRQGSKTVVEEKSFNVQ